MPKGPFFVRQLYRSLATMTTRTSDRIASQLDKIDVWTVFSPLAGLIPKDSLNLGQGFMSWAPPRIATDAAKAALDDVSANHYSLAKGRIALREQLSKQYSSSFKTDGSKLDPNEEILVTAGANGGIYAFLAAFINPGDEVIVLEPFFDQYIPDTTFQGGVPKYVPFRPPPGVETGVVAASDWKIDRADLEAAITPKSKVLILNTPHNPIGKVFTKEELEDIADFAKKHDLLVLSDEVCEVSLDEVWSRTHRMPLLDDCLAFKPHNHVRIASLPGMYERTITCGSAGKSFAATGWRVGWLIGPKELVKPSLAAATRIVFCVNSPLQEAVADAFANQGNFFEEQREAYIERRAALTEALDTLGVPYTIPHGSYFVLISVKNLKIPSDFKVLDLIKDRSRDWHAAWFIAQQAGVVAIPCGDFYSDDHSDIGANFVRLAFCKDPEYIRQAGERLLKLKPFLQ